MSHQIALEYARQIDENIRTIIEQFKAYEGKDPAFLYERPAPEEWSVMENLAHIAEFPPYWIAEFATIVKEPGQTFGRTHADPDRIAAIEDHARDALTPTLNRIENSRDQALEILQQIDDGDWQKTGQHSTRGVMTLHEMLEFFVIKHLQDHVQQTREALKAAEEK